MKYEAKQLNNTIKIKIVILGDRSVGKSSIISRFITNSFDQTMQPTIGIDFMTKTVKYKGVDYRIQFWDTAGQQKYRCLATTYIKGADACIFVYDCTRINSYSNLPLWLDLLKQLSKDDCPPVQSIIVGNKCDAEFNSQLLQKSKLAIQQQHEILKNTPQFISSAKLDINISQIFEEILSRHMEKKQQNQKNSGTHKLLSKVRIYTGSRCCK